MDEAKFEQLVRDHPDLFEKSREEYFSVGNGWYNILSTLCTFISGDVIRCRSRLKYALENPNDKFIEPINKLEEKLAKALEELPVIEQVKEKFGTLRFYTDRGSPEVHNYISFAEAMTAVTCEECGAPGESRNDDWIKVLCDKHYKERAKDMDRVAYPIRKSKAPKLSDE